MKSDRFHAEYASNHEQMVCCGNKSLDVVQTGCCGNANIMYSRSKFICKDGNSSSLLPIQLYSFCSSKVFRKSPHLICCLNIIYNISTDPSRFACCHKKLYNISTHACCMKMVYSLNSNQTCKCGNCTKTKRSQKITNVVSGKCMIKRNQSAAILQT